MLKVNKIIEWIISVDRRVKQSLVDLPKNCETHKIDPHEK